MTRALCQSVAGCQRGSSGSVQRSPGKRTKSWSDEQSSAPCSMASAGQVCVRHEIPGGAQGAEELTEQRRVAAGGFDDRRARLGQPGVDEVERLLHLERALEAERLRRQPEEGLEHRPGEGDRLGSRERVLDPPRGRIVARGGLVDRIEKDVDVRKLHFRNSSFRTISSSSRAADRRRARSRSTPGRRPPSADGCG